MSCTEIVCHKAAYQLQQYRIPNTLDIVKRPNDFLKNPFFIRNYLKPNVKAKRDFFFQFLWPSEEYQNLS